MLVTLSQNNKNVSEKKSPHKLNRHQSYQTPQKYTQQETAQKTLMKNVIQKISQSKRNSGNSKNIKKLRVRDQSIERESKQNEYNEKKEEKNIILDNQSSNSPGFYEYINWIKLHAKFLAYVDKKYMEEFWKILRLINYGEVQIPTGLIYQIFVEIKSRDNGLGFEKIINNFLRENQTLDSYKTFKEVKHYIGIQEIEKQYKGIKQSPKIEQNMLKQRCKSSKNVFERNFAEAKARTVKKISSVCKNLVEEAKQMSEKPKISAYKSQSYNSLIKPERICHHTQKHKYKNEQQKYLEYLEQNTPIEKLFKAKQMDRSIFEGGIDHIPGVVSHLSRNKYCQAEKLRAKREEERPQYSKKKIY